MRKYFALLALFVCLPVLANAGTLVFDPPETDMSIRYLGMIFGVVTNVLHGTGSQILANLFGLFNSAVLTVGGAIIMYTFFVSTLNTAHEGELLGKRWSSIAIPVRLAFGVGLMLPQGGGYSGIQVLVMWVVVQGVGLADSLWFSIIDYLGAGGVIIQSSSSSPSNASLYKGQKATQNLFKSLVCMQGLQSILNAEQSALQSLMTGLNSGGAWLGSSSLPASVPNFSSELITAMNSTPGPYTEIPSVKSGQFSQYNGACGRIYWDVNTEGNAITDYYGKAAIMQDLRNGRIAGVQQMIRDLAPYADQLVSNYQLIPPQTPQVIGSCLGAVDCYYGNWNGGKPSLLRGNLVTYSFLDYMAMLMAPLNKAAFQTSGGPSTAWFNDAKAVGWMSAGVFYWDVVALNKQMQGFNDNQIPNIKVSDEAASKGTFCNRSSRFRDLGDSCRTLGGWVNDPEFLTYLSDSVKYKMTYAELPSQTAGADSVSGAEAAVGALAGYLGGAVAGGGEKASEGLHALGGLAAGGIGGNKNDPNAYSMFRGYAGYGISEGLGYLGDGIGMATRAVGDFMNSEMGIRGFLEGFIALADDMRQLRSSQSNNSNPLFLLTKIGSDMINICNGIWILSAGLAALASTLAACKCYGFGTIANTLASMLAPFIALFLMMLFSIGSVLAYYVPMIPFVIFSFSVMGWFIAVVESMVAAPIVALGLMFPEGHETFGKAEAAIFLLLNVFLRPGMMVIGFITAISLSYAGVWMVNEGFGYMYLKLMNLSQTGQTGGNAMQGMSYIWYLVAMPCFYGFIVLQVVQKAFSLIHHVPDKILRWLSGGTQESFGSEAASGVGEGMRGMAQSGGQQAGQIQGQEAQKKIQNAQGKGSSDSPNADVKGSKGKGGGGGGGVNT